VKGQGPQNLTTAFAGVRKAGRQHACTFDTFDVAHSAKVETGFAKRMRVASEVRGLKRACRLQEPGAGFPPMTAEVQTSQPARSDSPDLIDGGPDGRGYSPKGQFRQAKMAGFTGP
jgi:hypothetical protein